MRFQQRPDDDGGTGDDLDLAAVLNHYGVRYRPTKRGNQMVPCPLGHDRHPSMSVNLTKNVWKCHRCSGGGGALALIIKMEGLKQGDYGGARRAAAAHGLAARGTGDGGGLVPVEHHRWGSGVSAGSGDRPRGGGYVPAWRRRRS